MSGSKSFIAEAHSGLAWAIAYQYTYDPEFADPEWQTNIQPIAREALRHCATLGEAMHLIPAFFMSWDYIQDKDAYWHWPNAWNADCGNVWSAPEFPAFVAEQGLVEYWREVGWPAMCQPDGDSVVCGEPTQTMRK